MLARQKQRPDPALQPARRSGLVRWPGEEREEVEPASREQPGAVEQETDKDILIGPKPLRSSTERRALEQEAKPVMINKFF